MPNYEIIRKLCELRKKEVILPATYVSDPGGDGKLIRHINDCLNKDNDCKFAGCKFCTGDREPFNAENV